jgi:replicative DNA helicase/DNA-binding MarR family transcriptional regulator
MDVSMHETKVCHIRSNGESTDVLEYSPNGYIGINGEFQEVDPANIRRLVSLLSGPAVELDSKSLAALYAGGFDPKRQERVRQRTIDLLFRRGQQMGPKGALHFAVANGGEVVSDWEYATPPPSTDSRVCVIGHILAGVSPKEIKEKSGLKPEDFQSDFLGWVYKVALEMAEKGLPTTYSELVQELQRSRRYQDVAARLNGALDAVPAGSCENAVYHARRVVEAYELKRLADLGQGLKSMQEQNAPLEEVLKQLERIKQSEARLRSTIPGEGNSKLNVIWAKELEKAELPEPSWLIPGILPDAGVCVLAGTPKVGKSWLALQFAVAVASGRDTGGIEACKQTRVLYLALEDTERRIKSRLANAKLGFPENLCFAYEWKRLHEGGLEELRRFVVENNIGFVIIDTLAKVRPPQNGKGNPYAEDYLHVGLLKSLADELGITVLLVHHKRKAKGLDPIEDVSGTTGLTGAVDTILLLDKKRGEEDGTLLVTGREVEEEVFALKFTDCKWEICGSASEYAKTEERQRVLEVLREANGPLSVKEIAELIEKSEAATRMMLSRMCKEGVITRSARGCYELSADERSASASYTEEVEEDPSTTTDLFSEGEDMYDPFE